MNPIIIIPARMASERLPGKPLLDVGGAPMIVQVWRRAVAGGAGDVVVACDGKEIAAAIEKEGGRAILTDPKLPSGSDRICAALRQFDAGKSHDIVVNVQGDMPTMDPAILRDALALMENPAVDIATLAAPLEAKDRDDPAVVKVAIEGLGIRDWGLEKKKNSLIPNAQSLIPLSGRALSFSRQPPAGDHVFQHIGLYVYRRAALERFVQLPQSPLEKKEKLEQLRALEAGMRIDVAIVAKAPVGVDTKETLEQARQAYEQPAR